jgi:hypothetical protein
MQVRGQLADGIQTPVLLEQELLVTEGPVPLVPGTLDMNEVASMTAFELRARSRLLGVLPLTPAPVAMFDTEGGVRAQPEYVWSSAAEDELEQRLAKLIHSPADK